MGGEYLISAEDIEAFAPEAKSKIRKIDAGLAQYYMRQAFEEGYRAAAPDNGASMWDPKKGKWFDHWLLSQTRAVLVANGLITGLEGYK